MSAVAGAVRKVKDALERRNQLEAGAARRLSARMRDLDEETARRARECGCQGCPDCCPDVAKAAEAAGVTFLQALAYVLETRRLALTKLVEMRSPAATRPERKAQERFSRKARKNGHEFSPLVAKRHGGDLDDAKAAELRALRDDLVARPVPTNHADVMGALSSPRPTAHAGRITTPAD